jgi:asparagine synthase (glutamine-hydrolysing)
MFCFAIFDKINNSITCCRDGFGIKPFYYFSDKSHFIFSSEIPSIINLHVESKKLSLSKIHKYLVLGAYDNSSETFYENIYNLPPGHFFTIDLNSPFTIEIQKWWNPSIVENNYSFKDATELVRQTFLDNIKLHLRSDVKVGAALSGGLDSSAILCAMKYLEPQIDLNSFSYISSYRNIDEERWIDFVNNHLSAKEHKISISDNDLFHDLDPLIKSQAEPFMSTSIYAQFRVFKSFRDNDITVSLEGQGADELFAGYNGYPIQILQDFLHEKQYYKIISFIYHWSRWPGRGCYQGAIRLISLFVPTFLHDFALKVIGRDKHPLWINENYFEKNGVDMNLRKNSLQLLDTNTSNRSLFFKLKSEMQNGGLQALLRHSDRNSMYWSVESRVPFLTTDLADIMLTMPSNFLVSDKGETKKIFREAMRGIVPDVILDRRDKVGFATPEFNWLKKLSPQIEKYISFSNEIPFLNSKECINEVNLVLNGKKTNTSYAWRLINLCRWIELQNY